MLHAVKNSQNAVRVFKHHKLEESAPFARGHCGRRDLVFFSPLLLLSVYVFSEPAGRDEPTAHVP